MLFALFPNLSKPNAISIAKEIKEFLLTKDIKVTCEDEKASLLDIPPLSAFNPSDINFIITLGGDGTILRVLHKHPELTAPIVGINLGSLGFMADIPTDEIFHRLKDLLEGNFTIHERFVLEGHYKELSSFAVNEIVFHRERNPCLIELSIFLNDVYLNTFSADGLIISTPNGSTAYSLAAGGPILTPDLSTVVITPICPHTISNRPIVVGSANVIKVEYLSEYEPIEVIYDGFPVQRLETGQHIQIYPSTRKFRLVTFEKHHFFSTLRTKLGWAGKLKT